MPTPALKKYLEIALKVQSPPYTGIRVVDGALLASDGCRMVVYTPGDGFVQGEGVIEPVNARMLLTYAKEVYITQIRVARNTIEFDVAFSSFTKSGFAIKNDTVRLAAFDALNSSIETVLPRFRPPIAQLVASDARVKNIRRSVLKREKVAFDEQSASFCEACSDAHWYSARQVQDALIMFGAKSKVNVLVGSKKELVFEANGVLYAITPFVERKMK